MMLSPRRLIYRLRAFVDRRARDASLDAEMRHHIECETADRIARGMSPEEARRTALRDFGGVDRHMEDTRDRRGFRVVEELGYDARQTLRVLRRNAGYTTAAVLTLALGIGLTSAIFSVVHGVLLEPLPYEDPDRLVSVWEQNPSSRSRYNVVSVENFEAWRERSRSFTALVALVPAPLTLGAPDPERIMGAEVSPEYFALLGVRPAIGRVFSAEESRDGGPPAVMLSARLWQRRFGGDSSIVGRAIRLDEKPFSVVGVMPADFDPPKLGWLPEHELWLPFVPTAANRAWGRVLLVLGRLRDGATIESARREMRSIAARRATEDKRNERWTATVVGLGETITGDVRRPLVLLMGAVSLLMLMAAVNVGTLILGFLRRRAQELAVRRAIGASTGRIFRQLLTHTSILGAAGCIAGITAAIGGVRLIVALMPPEIPRASSIGVEGEVLLFTVAVAIVATVGVTIGAAMRNSRGGAPSLATGRAAAGRASTPLGNGTLVVAEIALGVVLTVFAGLMIRSFVKLRAVDLGFDARGVVTARVSLPTTSYDSPERQRAFFDSWRERIAAIRGVEAVSFVTSRPLACCAPSTGVTLPGEAATPSVASMIVDVRYADSAYFAALRIPLLAGDGIGNATGGVERVVVNRALARTLWPHGSVVGRQLRVGLYGGLDAEVAGVVGDVHLVGPRTPPRGTVYLAATRHPSTIRDVVVRATVPPEALIVQLRTTLQSLDPSLPLADPTPLLDEVDEAVARDRFTTTLLTLFAAVSLVLAAIGIFGVFAAEVTARRKEIGVRLALGARGAGVVGLVLSRALLLAAVGAGVGVIAGLLLARPMSAVVFAVPTWDPLSFAAVAALLLVLAAVATLVPAIRASRVSPLEAIRND